MFGNRPTYYLLQKARSDGAGGILEVWVGGIPVAVLGNKTAVTPPIRRTSEHMAVLVSFILAVLELGGHGQR